MAEIDRMMFERLQNVQTWRQLEILQEARIGDVDKRLAQFLDELRQGYGKVYRQLFFATADHRIVAASDPPLIGQAQAPAPPWLEVDLPGGKVVFDPFSLKSPDERAELRIRASIEDLYTKKELGQLYVVLNWREVFDLLDQAVQLKTRGEAERTAVLLDEGGRIIAGSGPIRERGLLSSQALAAWRPPGADQGVFLREGGDVLGDREVLVGFARGRGYQGFSGLGWSLMVIQSSAKAFTPLWRLWQAFFLLLAVTALLASGFALWTASKIARPIVELTEFTQAFMRTGQTQATPMVAAGSSEVHELHRTFVQMIADLERSREQFIRAAKLAVVGEMAAVMAHEVRTPLGIVSSCAQMLQRESGLSPEGREMTGFILDETQRLNRLVTVLLDCARPRPPKFQRHDPHAILQRVLELVGVQAGKKHLHIQMHPGVDAPSLECDEEQMIQAFLNLVLNAIQILQSGGTLRLRTRKNGDLLAIEVMDDGPGIPLENRERVFDPFFTTRKGGTGLGLTAVRQIIHAHGGEVSVESGELGGACFLVVLPTTRETPQ
jgi:signal transduction histidine kinase